jgi:hypothetical protein
VLALAGHTARLASLESGGQAIPALDHAIVDAGPGSTRIVLSSARALFRALVAQPARPR